ncbi:uncharacterized protein LOC121728634 isoform X5 [Aricia agestis]|uniref:uncharacterized protein LOC121728634 isoform X5 n=2 Tax=Aricia agestis TaxID=91739 RepID=UPI001C204558|nr:uncharacterized protein LOC121728634 isoform X5 [Aricia agestis]
MADMKILIKKRSSIKSKTNIEMLSEEADSAASLVEREDFDRQFFSLVALTRSLLGSSVSNGSEAGFRDADSAVKAVHLELVSDLTTEAYMAALNRFVARRGKPRSITSDNGTNFVGACNEIYKFINSSNVASEMAQEGIEFIFTPAYSPHFNSLAEAAVKSTKKHLKRLLNQTHFTFEELATCLTHIEAVLNSRPLTPLSSDPKDFCVLTPAHFLIGRPLLCVPCSQVTDANISRLDRWKRVQHIRTHFWGRFHNEYTSLLQVKTKWFASRGELKPGSLVLIKDKMAPPLLWSLGRVIKTYPGVDGVTRVAELKTRKGTIRRAFNSICPLPID